MPKCSNHLCSRTADVNAIYSFPAGPRISSPLCEACKAMLLEGDNAVGIEIEEVSG